MEKIISYKFRIMDVKDRVEKKFYSFANACNDVWNMYVQYNIDQLKDGKEFVSGYTFSTMLTQLKKTEKYAYLNNFQARMLGAVPSKGEEAFTKDKGTTRHIIDTRKTIINKETKKKEENPCYKKLRADLKFTKNIKRKLDNDPNFKTDITDYAGFPKIHATGEKLSFSMDKQMFKIDLANSRVWIPGLDGKKSGRAENRPDCWITFRQHRKVEGTPANITIKKEGQYWYIAIQCDMEVPNPVHSSKETMGIDMGVAKFATCSNGKIYPTENDLVIIDKEFARLEKKKKFIQRKLEKQIEGSNRYNKTKQRLNELCRHTCRIRMNLIHNVSNDLTNEYKSLIIEDLKLVNMTRSAKGSNAKHGKNVKAKSGLNKSILNRGCGYLKQQLEYKTKWKGGELTTVNPQYTSQRCSSCGYTDKENRKEQDKFKCLKCGHAENADVNAAKNILKCGTLKNTNAGEANNILAEGYSVTARGGNTGNCVEGTIKSSSTGMALAGRGNVKQGKFGTIENLKAGITAKGNELLDEYVVTSPEP